jgi:hypothetical protein
MSFLTQVSLGVALLAVGAVLALGFPDAEFLFFDGRPLGVVLAVIGLIDVGEALWRRRAD